MKMKMTWLLPLLLVGLITLPNLIPDQVFGAVVNAVGSSPDCNHSDLFKYDCETAPFPGSTCSEKVRLAVFGPAQFYLDIYYESKPACLSDGCDNMTLPVIKDIVCNHQNNS